MDGLLTIGQVARGSGLTVRALRHYDEIGLLRPVEVDPQTGYRHYSREQVEVARTIRQLRELDLPVESVQDYLHAADPAAARAILLAHAANLDARTWRLLRLQHRLRGLIEGDDTMADTADARTDEASDDERRLAVDLFNEVWRLLEQEGRGTEDDERMLHAAHASWWHWSNAGGDEQLAVGDWQCSRVYAVLGRAEPSLHHADRSLERAAAADLPTWVHAAAHEARARASAVAGDLDAARREADEARALCAKIDDPDDRDVIEGDLATLPLD
jgi:DNA-binding transcriptional MerR regulator